MTPQEIEYDQNNNNEARNVAYAVNNNQMAVEDLPADFDTSLLSKDKANEHAAFHSAKPAKKGEK